MSRPPGSPATPLLAAAVGALALGVVAVVTGGGAAAVLAGLASVVCAGLALRSPTDTTAGRRPDAGRGVDAASPEAASASATPGPPAIRAAPASATPTPASTTPASTASPASPAPPEAPPSNLLTGAFVEATLRNRVAVARRALRPLSLLHFEVLELGDADGKRPVPAAAVAAVLGDTLREADAAAVLGDGSYLCILEDTGEDGAVWTAERIRRNLAEADPGRRFRAGVASYPNHGLDVDELRLKARTALEVARRWTRDRIEVATGT